VAPDGTFLCTNTAYPPLPGFPAGNTWFSPVDLTNPAEHVSCTPITSVGALKLAWRALKFLEELEP
jgi:hypothetical protein